VLFNGVTTVLLYFEPTTSGDPLLDEVTRTLMQMAGIAVPIDVVIVVQGAIVGERELGTAAWIMSKPASRNAFVLAKLAAHVTGFVATAVVVPSVILVVEAGAVLGRAPSVASSPPVPAS
jgi:ABC-2 type transport system permease protein